MTPPAWKRQDDTGRDGQDGTRARCVQSSAPLEQVRLVTVGGMQTALARPKGNVCIFDVSGMSHGLYLVVCETEGDGTPVVRKVILK